MSATENELEQRLRSQATPFPQGSHEWTKLRACMLTASDIGAVLDMNPYCTRTQVIRYKSGLEPRTVDRFFTNHGHKHEDAAAQAYCTTTGKKCFELGLVTHRKYAWLGASPDRVTFCGRAVEIKVPLRRLFGNNEPIPRQYWAQMQMQMEVLDLPVCDFVQYNAISGYIRIDEVVRDYAWWNSVLPRITAAVGKILDIRCDHELQEWETVDTNEQVII